MLSTALPRRTLNRRYTRVGSLGRSTRKGSLMGHSVVSAAMGRVDLSLVRDIRRSRARFEQRSRRPRSRKREWTRSGPAEGWAAACR